MNNEKINLVIQQFAQTLKEQRNFIACQTLEEFAKTLNDLYGSQFNVEILSQMESGNVNIPIFYWLCIWTYFQNIDKIKGAYDAKEMLYLAQQEFLPEIEQEIINQHEKTR